VEALRLLELLLCKCSPAEVTEVPSDTGMICAQNLFADCQRARVGIGRVGQAIRALVHHGEVGESLGHRRMTLAKGFPFGRQGKLQQPLGVCISALTGIVDGEELTGLRRRRVLAAERAVLDGDRPQIELFGFRKTVLHFVDGGEILQTQRHIGVLDAQRFLPDRQRAPEIIFGPVRRPWRVSAVPILLSDVATSGCVGPNAFSRRAATRRCSASASA